MLCPRMLVSHCNTPALCRFRWSNLPVPPPGKLLNDSLRSFQSGHYLAAIVTSKINRGQVFIPSGAHIALSHSSSPSGLFQGRKFGACAAWRHLPANLEPCQGRQTTPQPAQFLTHAQVSSLSSRLPILRTSMKLTTPRGNEISRPLLLNRRRATCRPSRPPDCRRSHTSHRSGQGTINSFQVVVAGYP